MESGLALNLAKEFASQYYKYCTLLTPGNHELLYQQMVNTRIEQLMEYIRSNNVKDVAYYIHQTTDEYRRLCEYREKFGTIEPPAERRPGGRILP